MCKHNSSRRSLDRGRVSSAPHPKVSCHEHIVLRNAARCPPPCPAEDASHRGAACSFKVRLPVWENGEKTSFPRQQHEPPPSTDRAPCLRNQIHRVGFTTAVNCLLLCHARSVEHPPLNRIPPPRQIQTKALELKPPETPGLNRKNHTPQQQI